MDRLCMAQVMTSIFRAGQPINEKVSDFSLLLPDA